MNEEMKGAIFDLDGTLIDSMPDWGNTWISMLAEAGISCPEGFVQMVTPLGTVGTAQYLQTLGLQRSVAEIVDEFESRLIGLYADKIPLKSGVRAYLEKLRSCGVKLCVLTASPQKIVVPCLENRGILDLFEFTCSCADLGMTKTDPEIYRVTAARLGVSVSEAVFFDDNFQALEAAHRSGIATVGVYDASSEALRESIRGITDRYIGSFEEMLQTYKEEKEHDRFQMRTSLH